MTFEIGDGPDGGLRELPLDATIRMVKATYPVRFDMVKVDIERTMADHYSDGELDREGFIPDVAMRLSDYDDLEYVEIEFDDGRTERIHP